MRRAETKLQPDLKGSRWALLKDASDWNLKQITLMHYLQRSNLKTARAWRLKEALRTVFAEVSEASAAETALKRWIRWARRSRLAPFKRLGQTLREHLAGILEHFHAGLSNGFVEAMNGLIRAAIVRARGYGTDRRLITMAYLIGGKLKHLPANPWTTLDVQTAKRPTSTGNAREPEIREAVTQALADLLCEALDEWPIDAHPQEGATHESEADA